MDKDNQTTLSVPVAIVVAGIFIAGAIIISNRSAGSPITPPSIPLVPKAITLRDVTSGDHIRGSLNAKVKIVEYSDPECPFCKVFQGTMKKIFSDYGGSENVAWVYRHFPIDSLHPKARKEAEATECAFEQGGNDAFWKYLDRIFEVTPSNNGLDPAQLKTIATYVGLNADKLQTCIDSGKYASKIQADENDGTTAGGTGTPYSVIIDVNGNKSSLDGALPYEDVKAAIDKALGK